MTKCCNQFLGHKIPFRVADRQNPAFLVYLHLQQRRVDIRKQWLVRTSWKTERTIEFTFAYEASLGRRKCDNKVKLAFNQFVKHTWLSLLGKSALIVTQHFGRRLCFPVSITSECVWVHDIRSPTVRNFLSLIQDFLLFSGLIFTQLVPLH